MIKLSTNEELYKICESGEVPSDEVFRRGNNIRYVWVFKIYNMVNLLLPLLPPMLVIQQKFPKDLMFVEILATIKADIAIYFNFIGRCIEETSLMNPFFLPYNDCLQYYESVKEYRTLRAKHERLIEEVSHLVPEHPIKFVDIDETTFSELEVLAVRIQLISTSLRSTGNKENSRMITDYNQKL